MEEKKQASQYEFLELLARGGTLGETLHQLLQVIEAQVPEMLGLILLLDEEGQHLHIGAAPSLPQAYLDSIEGLEIGPMVGSCGTACYTRERVIVTDIASDRRWDGLRSLALKSGLRACWSEPVLSGEGEVVGTFAMYYREPRAPTSEELQLIATGAHLVGLAVERQRADDALCESERRLSTLMSTLPGMAYRCANDRRWTMAFVSQGSRELIGYEPAELVGEGGVAYGDLIHPDDLDSVWNGVQQALAEGRPFQLTYRIRTAGNEEKWVWEKGRGVYGGDGRVVALEGFITDITERVLAEQLLERRVEERTRELSTLLDVSQNVTSTLALEPLLRQILDQLKAVIDYDGASVLILEENGRQDGGRASGERGNGTLRTVAYRGPVGEETMLQLRLPLERDSATRAIVEEQKPMVIPDVRGSGGAAGPLTRAFQETVGEHLDTTFGNVRSWLGVPLAVKDSVLGMLTLSHGQPDAYAEEHGRLALTFANQVAVAIENARLYREAERRADEAEMLFDVQQAINRRLDEDGILQLIADGARRLTGARGAVVFLLEEDGRGEEAWLRVAVISGDQAGSAEGVRLPLAGSLAEEAIRSGAPLCIDDATADPHVQADPRRRRLLRQGQVQSLIVAPLVAGRGPLGAISLSDKRLPSRPGETGLSKPQGGPFDEADRQLLTLLASSAVVGLENARLYREVQQTAVREERSRLARDLHDSVTQSLYSLTLFTEAARQMVEEVDNGPSAGAPAEALAHHLHRIGEIGQQSLKEMRLLVYELRPPVLAEQGLISALRQRLEAVEGRAGVEARLVVDELVSLPPQMEEALYRIAQEALNNILKHAQATAVTVTLQLERDGFVLEVEDDGVGFEPGRAGDGAGQGLRNIRERAAALGATVDIVSAPGAGTHLTIRGPLTAKAEKGREK